MDTQPPQDPRTMTWVDQQNRSWRVERAGDRWSLAAHPVFAADRDVWIGDFSSKQAAIDAAREAPPAE
jgi:hypothetical protein